MSRWLEVQPGSLQFVLHSWILNSKISEATLGQQNHAFRREGWEWVWEWGKFGHHFPWDFYNPRVLIPTWWRHSARARQLKMLPTAWGIRKNTRHYKISTLTQFFDVHTWAACVQLTYIMQIMCQTYISNFGIDVMSSKSVQLKTPRLNEYSSLYMNKEMYSVIHEIVHFVFSSKPQDTCF